MSLLLLKKPLLKKPLLTRFLPKRPLLKKQNKRSSRVVPYGLLRWFSERHSFTTTMEGGLSGYPFNLFVGPKISRLVDGTVAAVFPRQQVYHCGYPNSMGTV